MAKYERYERTLRAGGPGRRRRPREIRHCERGFGSGSADHNRYGVPKREERCKQGMISLECPLPHWRGLLYVVSGEFEEGYCGCLTGTEDLGQGDEADTWQDLGKTKRR